MAACGAVTLTFAACVSTEHESAQIERESRAAVAAEAAKERAAKPRSQARSHARHGSSHATHAGSRRGANG